MHGADEVVRRAPGMQTTRRAARGCEKTRAPGPDAVPAVALDAQTHKFINRAVTEEFPFLFFSLFSRDMSRLFARES